MFVRVKPAGQYRYLQIAENYREGKKVKQKVLCTLGRVDQLAESGKVDALAQSLLRFGSRLKVIDLHREGALKVHSDRSIGPALVFQRLWGELGIAEVIGQVLADRNFELDVERQGGVLDRAAPSDGSGFRPSRGEMETGLPDLRGRIHRAASAVPGHGLARAARRPCLQPR